MVPKFRAWDKDSKVMRSWKDLILEKDGGDDFWLIGYKENACITSFDHDQTLMQSTGLKDKNGVEIFEGDVLKNTRNGKIRRVHWNPSCASFHLSKHGIEEAKVEYWSLSNPQWSYEIIGNIYENPELLEPANEI